MQSEVFSYIWINLYSDMFLSNKHYNMCVLKAHDQGKQTQLTSAQTEGL